MKIMKITLIGAGNVGSHLAKLFRELNYEIVEVFSRTLEKAEKVAEMANASAVTDLSKVNAFCDIYIVAVHDDAIKTVSDQLEIGNGIIAHTSGAASIELLNKHKNYGSWYPLQTFTPNRQPNWQEIPICLQANDGRALELLLDLARTVNKNATYLTDRQRSHLHIAAVFVNNFINHLLGVSQSITTEQKLSNDLLMPLLKETISKAQTAHPFLQQTGPAKRGDMKTIEKHLSLLSESHHELYLTISINIQKTHERE